jgi:hypothetical protein
LLPSLPPPHSNLLQIDKRPISCSGTATNHLRQVCLLLWVSVKWKTELQWGLTSYGPLPGFANKVLLEHSHVHLFGYHPCLPFVLESQLSNCNRDCSKKSLEYWLPGLLQNELAEFWNRWFLFFFSF